MKMLKINQITLPVSHTDEALDQAVQKRLRLKTVPEYTIVKKSIDAREKNNLRYSYSVELPDDIYPIPHTVFNDKNIMLINKAEYDFDLHAKQYAEAYMRTGIHHPPVIVGTGPAGLFCAYHLALAGFSPILIERGMPVEERIQAIEAYWNGADLLPDSNVQFGEGGAGTFSDGKLNTMIKDRAGRIDHVLRTFAKFGAADDILFVNKPHIGTDCLRNVVRNMRNRICELGGTVFFQTCLTDLTWELPDPAARTESARLRSITVRQQKVVRELPCECLILAIGHSARDTYSMLLDRGLLLTPKAFAVGLRIEHDAAMIQNAQYGTSKEAMKLPPADYKLTHQTPEGRAVYSFCMCPGGYIVDASSEPGGIAVNGMSNRSRDARNSNSAIVVNVTPQDFPDDSPLGGIDFQRRLERAAYAAGQGAVPLQLFGDYRQHCKSSGTGSIVPDIKGRYHYADLHDCLPKFVNDAIINGILTFEQRIHGFAREDAILCGVESRTSAPVRIERDARFCSSRSGVFPCGEGAGYAGGITSAAVDGIKTAEAVAGQFQPLY